jgi:MFS family permease
MVIPDSTIVNIALPTAQHDLGFSNANRQWVVTGYALAFGSLLLLGGRLADLFGRKRLLVIGMIGFVGALIWLREGERTERVPLDIAGAVTVVVGLAGIVYGLGNAATGGWGDPVTLSSVIVGLVFLAVFVLVERRAAHPLLPLGCCWSAPGGGVPRRRRKSGRPLPQRPPPGRPRRHTGRRLLTETSS